MYYVCVVELVHAHYSSLISYVIIIIKKTKRNEMKHFYHFGLAMRNKYFSSPQLGSEEKRANRYSSFQMLLMKNKFLFR